MTDDLDRELLEAEALASECDTPEAWEAAIRLRAGGAKLTVHPTDKAEAVTETPAPNHRLPEEKLAHPVAPNVEAPLPTPSAVESPVKNDDTEIPMTEIDKEYYDTFNATVEEIKNCEPEQIQELEHRLERMILRAKIQKRAMRVTREGKLQFVTEKRRAAMRAKDSEFMTRNRKLVDGSGTAKTPRAKSTSDKGLSQLEKQIKQFIKLNMSNDVIKVTLQGLHKSLPENLDELITKHRK